MTIIDLDVTDEALEDVTRIIKDLAGEVIDLNPDGPGGGNPNLKIKAQNPEHARQIVREIYNDAGLTDAEIDDLYIKQS
jgi:hypothetical protein